MNDLEEELIDYIDILHSMHETTGYDTGVLYTMDERRSQIHNNIFNLIVKEIGLISKKRLNVILHNLDQVINLELPIQKWDSVGVCGRELYREIMSTKGKYFLQGKTSKFSITYSSGHLKE